MKVYNFEANERFYELIESYNRVEKTLNSLADCSRQYTKLHRLAKLTRGESTKNINSIERALLIEFYTFGEQIIKNLIYELLKKHTQSGYIIKFINNKLPEETFSPNIKYDNLTCLINEYNSNFKFLITKNNDKMKKYEKMIKARHIYSHSGTYSFDFKNYKDIIEILEYLKLEVKLLLEENKSEEFRESYYSLKKELNKIMNLKESYINNPSVPQLTEKLIEKFDLLENNLNNFLRMANKIKLFEKIIFERRLLKKIERREVAKKLEIASKLFELFNEIEGIKPNIIFCEECGENVVPKKGRNTKILCECGKYLDM